MDCFTGDNGDKLKTVSRFFLLEAFLGVLARCVLDFEFDFAWFVSDFEIRISDLLGFVASEKNLEALCLVH